MNVAKKRCAGTSRNFKLVTAFITFGGSEHFFQPEGDFIHHLILPAFFDFFFAADYVPKLFGNVIFGDDVDSVRVRDVRNDFVVPLSVNLRNNDGEN